MAVITISRQFGSGGDEIASRICEILGYRQFDKRLIAQAATEAGLSEEEIIDYSEESHKMLSFMDRLLGRAPGLTQAWNRPDYAGPRPGEVVPLSEEAALTLVQKAVRSAYRMGGIVIVGRGGQAILRDVPGVLHIRIEAPIEDRIQRVKSNLKMARHAYTADIDARRDAQDWIIERDAASADYLKRFYHIDWADPLLYHLMINTGRVTLEEASQIIAGMAQQIPEPEKLAAA